MAAFYTTTTTAATTFFAKMVEQKIRELFQANLFLPRFITVEGLSGSKVKSFPYWPAESTAAGLTEGTDTEPVAFTTTAADITVAEVGINLGLTDFTKKTTGITPEQMGVRGARAIGRKIETDIAALFSGFSRTVGTTGNEITLDTLINGATLLDTSEAPPERIAVVAPKTAGILRKLIAGASGSTAAIFAGGSVDPSFKAIPGFVCDFLGIPVYWSNFVPKINALDVDFCGAIFCRDAIGMAVMSDVEVEVERNASLRASEIVAVSTYGVGEMQDLGGVGIVSVVA
jgi:hypothetical protein